MTKDDSEYKEFKCSFSIPRAIRGLEIYLNEIGKFLLSIDRQRGKYGKLDVPFPIRLALDEAYIKTKDWYLKCEKDLEEIKENELEE